MNSTIKFWSRVGNLSAVQTALVLNAIKLYVNNLDPETATTVLANYSGGSKKPDLTQLADRACVTMLSPRSGHRFGANYIWLPQKATL